MLSVLPCTQFLESISDWLFPSDYFTVKNLTGSDHVMTFVSDPCFLLKKVVLSFHSGNLVLVQVVLFRVSFQCTQMI